MHHRIAKTLLLALAVLVLTEQRAVAILTPSYEILGWTKDSTFFVYTMGFDAPEAWHVLSALTAGEQVFTTQKEFDTFTLQHPLIEEIASGATSPDGAVVLEVDKANHPVLERGAQRLNVESFPAKGSLAHAWSPDGRGIGFLYVSQTCAPSGTGDFDCSQDVRALVDRTSGPRIKLVAKGLAPTALEAAAKAVATAGFRITKREAAQTARPRSMVYALKGQLEAAKKVAAAIPGGAEVQPLTWDEKFDLVVALGASAAR